MSTSSSATPAAAIPASSTQDASVPLVLPAAKKPRVRKPKTPVAADSGVQDVAQTAQAATPAPVPVRKPRSRKPAAAAASGVDGVGAPATTGTPAAPPAPKRSRSRAKPGVAPPTAGGVPAMATPPAAAPAVTPAAAPKTKRSRKAVDATSAATPALATSDGATTPAPPATTAKRAKKLKEDGQLPWAVRVRLAKENQAKFQPKPSSRKGGASKPKTPKGVNGYTLYYQERTDQLKNAMGSESIPAFGQLSVIISNEWKQLKPEAKLPYTEKAKAEELRRRRELIPFEEPKRARSGYTQFIQANKSECKEKLLPNFTKAMSNKWNLLPREERLIWEEKGKADKARAEEELKIYEENMNNHTQKLAADRAAEEAKRKEQRDKKNQERKKAKAAASAAAPTEPVATAVVAP